MTEFQEGWTCGYCDVDLGEQPWGITLKCPGCGKPLVTSGLDRKAYSADQIKYMRELGERAKRQNRQRYDAMREH